MRDSMVMIQLITTDTQIPNKSKKQVLDLSKIIDKYEFIPEEDIEGGVNGNMFFFKKGVPVKLEFNQFEVLLYAEKIKV